MTDSQNLLAEYARTGSEAAFRELVTRYVDLVYSTALRLVGGDTHRAEDVSQTVFIDLARLARTLSNDVMPGGWLHRHTCFVAANTMRGERRRQYRERQAVEMNALQDNSGADFSLVAPILDEAINQLDEADRAAILLRFFEQRDFRSVGQALGGSEDAARMRVNRALEKLESLLKRRNITASSAALAVALGANAVQAAPAGLALSISTAAALAGTTIATATATATKAIAMTTLQKTLIATTLIVAAGSGIYEARQASDLRTQIQNLEQQAPPFIAQIQQVQRERDDATNRLAALTGELATTKSNNAELLKLRAQVTQLQALKQQLGQSKKSAGSDANDPATQEYLAARAKGEQIARYLQQMPDKAIPEIKLLTDVDWLIATKEANFDTDADIRKTLRTLRALAKERLPVGSSLFSFTQSHNGQLPTDISQLKPYIISALGDTPMDDATLGAILQRYQLLHAGNVSDYPKDTWFIAEKAPVDKDYDSRAKFGNNMSTVLRTGLGETGDPDDGSY